MVYKKYITPLAYICPSTKLLKHIPHNILLPFYHTVTNNSPPHLKHLYKTSNTQKFQNDIIFLKKYFSTITPYNLINNDTINKPSFLLSFDDGLQECYTTIAPILKKFNITAIFFINTDFIDNRDMFYRFKASIIIDNINNNNIHSIAKQLNIHNNITFSNIKKHILNINYNNRHLLDNIAKTININFSDYLQKYSPYLSSSQIANLIKQGFFIGAHSTDHANFQEIPINQQIEKTVNSINYIKTNFNIDYSLFSFPFSDYYIPPSFFNQIKSIIPSIITFGTSGLKIDSINTNFQRISIEKNNSKNIIKSEVISYLIKKTFNKHIIIR